MIRLKTILTATLVLYIGLLSSCNRSSLEEDLRNVFIKSAQDEQRITSSFIKFDTDDTKERCADFQITNETNLRVMCIRGTLTGYNSTGDVVYEFPWSHGSRPALVPPHSKTTLENIGFEIPNEVIRLEYILDEFDLIN